MFSADLDRAAPQWVIIWPLPFSLSMIALYPVIYINNAHIHLGHDGSESGLSSCETVFEKGIIMGRGMETDFGCKSKGWGSWKARFHECVSWKLTCPTRKMKRMAEGCEAFHYMGCNGKRKIHHCGGVSYSFSTTQKLNLLYLGTIPVQFLT